VSFVCEFVDFSWSFVLHVPFAGYVPFLFERGEERVDGAGSEVDAEGLADFRDYLTWTSFWGVPIFFPSVFVFD
jgi:hypothetical protein